MSKVLIRLSITTNAVIIIISVRSTPILLTKGYHISQACTSRFLCNAQTYFFDCTSNSFQLHKHISFNCTSIFLRKIDFFQYVVTIFPCSGAGYISPRKFINIVVSLMVRLKRRKWILTIYKVLFKQLVIQYIFQYVMDKVTRMMNFFPLFLKAHLSSLYCSSETETYNKCRRSF